MYVVVVIVVVFNFDGESHSVVPACHQIMVFLTSTECRENKLEPLPSRDLDS